MPQVTVLVPLCACPLCGQRTIVELTPAQRLAQPDDTTHVCHPALGGCNHGFTDSRTREPRLSSAELLAAARLAARKAGFTGKGFTRLDPK